MVTKENLTNVFAPHLLDREYDVRRLAAMSGCEICDWGVVVERD